jgi:hypothetical protein
MLEEDGMDEKCSFAENDFIVMGIRLLYSRF